MTAIVALGAVTVGINLPIRTAELHDLGLTPGSETTPSVERMEEIRHALTDKRDTLPDPRSGGSVGNTAALLARAGVSCGFMGIGGNDAFGRKFVSDCEESSLTFLSDLVDGAVTSYDFYLYDENDVRTIIWTSGANALLRPECIDIGAIQNAELLLIDGFALSFGPESEAAVARSIEAAEEASVPFVLTLAGTQIVDGYRAFFDAYAPKAQMVAGNLGQAAVLIGLESTASLDQVRAELAKTSIDAIVTLDAGGAFARFGDEEVLVPTQAIDALDSTGAGDNFLGAFLAARRRGSSVTEALAVGNRVSGQVIQYDSARLPMSVDVLGLLQDAVRTAKGSASILE